MASSGIIDPDERQPYRGPQKQFVVSDTPLQEEYTRENPDPEHLTTSVDDI
jgi:hypothetical protein